MIRALTALLAGAFVLAAVPSWAVTRYAAAAATDSTGTCTNSSAPCTIQRACDVAIPGDTVLCNDGTYTTGLQADNTYLLWVHHAGSATQKITILSRSKWGAKLDGRSDLAANGVRLDARYIRFQDFDIFGFRETAINNVSGDFLEFVGNHVHDIGRNTCSTTVNGKDGYYSQVPDDVTIDGNVFNDIGRLMVGENGCGSGPAINHLDHAVYISSDRIKIRNNVFYNMRTGWPIQLYPSGDTRVQIVNNTFQGKVNGDPACSNNEVGQIIIGADSRNMVVDNNIFFNARGNLIHVTGSITITGEVKNNLTDLSAPLSVFDVSQSGVTQSGNIAGSDPLFVNVSPGATCSLLSGNPNFAIRLSSPAIDSGIDTSDPIDLGGRTRPAGAGYDIGACEFYPHLKSTSVGSKAAGMPWVHNR